MPKPTIVFVPGAWLPPSIYTSTTTVLAASGYPTVSLPLPSAGAVPAHPNFDGDVQGIRACLTRLIALEEKDVVLVVHSYTGMPGAEAPGGLGKRERAEKGLKGGVVRMVFINALVVPEGFCLTDGGAKFPAWMEVDPETMTVSVGKEDAKRIFFNDLDDEAAGEWAAKLLPQSVGVYASRTTYAAWKDIPSTYVRGKTDQSHFSAEMVDGMIAGARAQCDTALDVVEECDGGHCLMISHPEWLAGVVKRAAGEV